MSEQNAGNGELKPHVGFSRANKCWWYRVPGFATEAEARAAMKREASAPTAPGREDAVAKIAAYLKDRDEALFAVPDDVDDAERKASAEDIVRALSPSSAHPSQGLVEALEEAVTMVENDRTLWTQEWQMWLSDARAALSARGRDDGWFRIDDPENPAPKDGTVIWAQFRADIYPALRPEREDLARWNGLHVPLRHIGLAVDGFDVGWSIAAPVGHVGFPDEWIARWRPLPSTSSREG